MDHVAAAEVDGAVLREPAAAPDQKRIDRVDAADPEDDEGDPRLEIHAAEHRAEHQDRGDRREHELEVDERRLRKVEHAGSAEVRDLRLALQLLVIQHGARLAEEVVPEARLPADRDRAAEAHLERVEHPDDQDDREGDEREHHAVHGPALLHHAAVEHDETRDAHQPHERRRGHLPGVVAGVQPVGVQHDVSSSICSPTTKRPQDSQSPEASLPPGRRRRRPSPQTASPAGLRQDQNYKSGSNACSERPQGAAGRPRPPTLSGWNASSQRCCSSTSSTRRVSSRPPTPRWCGGA